MVMGMGWTDKKNDHETNGHSRSQTVLSRIQKNLLCRNTATYDLVKQETTDGCNRCRMCPNHKRRKLSDDQKYYLSLYAEGLLTRCIISDEEGSCDNYQTVRIEIVNEYPVLNICYGFYDHELLMEKYRHKAILSTANFRFSPRSVPNPWVQYGLDKVLYSNQDQTENLYVDGVPASTWMDIVEPVLQTMLVLRKCGRENRTNITKRKKPSPLHRNRRVIVGDVQSRYFMIGPHIDHYHDHRLGIMALFAHRLAELGERTWRHQARFFPQSDRVIPFLREHRESTRNKPQDRGTISGARKAKLVRSKSASNIALGHREAQSTLLPEDPALHMSNYIEQQSTERNRRMVFH